MTFKLKGSCVNISFFFFVTVCVALVLDTTDTAVLTLCAAALHEGGHLLCMFIYGERPSHISVAPFGFSITRLSAGSYRREMIIAFAGPLANILAAVIMSVIMLVCHIPQLAKPVAVNVSLAVFNLLPIEPLDCGRAVRCWLMCRMNTVRAEKTVFVIGAMCLVPVAATGFFVLIKSRYNITLLLASIYLSWLLLKRRE